MDHTSATASWLGVTWETLSWRPRDGATLSARQRSYLPRTYDSAVAPSIADAAIEFPIEVMAREAAAVFVITRFDTTAACALPPPTLLLLRSELSASSCIERLTSSARRIVEEETFGSNRSSGSASLIVANA